VSAFGEAYRKLFPVSVRDVILADQLRAAAGRPMTKAERFEQKVSYVYGVMDADSGITKEQVRRVLAASDGGSEHG
jgi:hypothetical protein